MRYRTQDKNGDYVFGQGMREILFNTPETVAQAVKTRLLLKTGEWFLDKTAGTPYAEEVLGMGTKATYDAAIRERILDTQSLGQKVVRDITSYSSSVNSTTRALTINATIDTIYGSTSLSVVI